MAFTARLVDAFVESPNVEANTAGSQLVGPADA